MSTALTSFFGRGIRLARECVLHSAPRPVWTRVVLSTSLPWHRESSGDFLGHNCRCGDDMFPPATWTGSVPVLKAQTLELQGSLVECACAGKRRAPPSDAWRALYATALAPRLPHSEASSANSTARGSNNEGYRATFLVLVCRPYLWLRAFVALDMNTEGSNIGVACARTPASLRCKGALSRNDWQS